MRRTVVLLILALAGCGRPAQGPKHYGKTITRLNLRTGPGLSNPVKVVLDDGARLALLGQQPGWYWVSFQGTRGFVSDRYVILIKDGLKLKPEHESILKEAGWLKYVTDYIDVLKYRDCGYFVVGDGLAVAYATVVNDKRWVEAAVAGYTDLQLAHTLVHEAAHLEVWTDTGDFGSQEYSRSKERDFLEHYRISCLQAGRPEDVAEVDIHLASLSQQDLLVQVPRAIAFGHQPGGNND